MKTKKTFASVIIWIASILCIGYYGYFIVYCSFTKDPTENFSTKFKFGVVQTTTDDDLSYISYIDGDLNKMYVQKVKYGGLGDTFDTPQTANSKAYLIPQDTKKSQDNSKLLSIDLTEGKKKTYDVGLRNITNYQVDTDAIYMATTSNDEVILSKFVKQSKETTTLSLGKVTLDTLRLHGDKLFAFTSADGKYVIQLINKNSLTVEKSYSIANFSGKVTSTNMFGDSLFFCYEDAANKANPTGIGSISLFDKEVVTVPLTLAHATQILHSDDCLIVTSDQSNEIAVYDTMDEKEQHYELKNTSIQCYVSGDYLYSLGDTEFYKYNLSDFSLDKKIPLSLKDRKDTKFHNSGFFTK